MGAGLLAKLQDRGALVSLTAENKIRVEAPEGMLDDHLREAIRQERESLLALLRTSPTRERDGSFASFAPFASARRAETWKARTLRTQRTQTSSSILRTRQQPYLSELKQLAPIPTGLPQDWREGLAHLPRMVVPTGFSDERWSLGVWWARRLAHEHGPAAFVMGWDAVDLFGLHPIAPSCRYDGMGLTFLLRYGDQLTSLDDERALTQSLSGAMHRVERGQRCAEAVPAWEWS
jgi:hypothetical protein